MKENRRIGMTLIEDQKDMGTCTLILSNEAIYGLKDAEVPFELIKYMMQYASSYLLDLKLGDRFTVVSELQKTVVTGIVTNSAETDVDLVVTNVFGGAFFIKDEKGFNIDN